MNQNSLIIYGLLITMLLVDIRRGEFFGAGAGIITGCLIIYFVLADKQDRKNIKNNLLWRTPKTNEAYNE